jgi:hypothetical protein
MKRSDAARRPRDPAGSIAEPVSSAGPPAQRTEHVAPEAYAAQLAAWRRLWDELLLAEVAQLLEDSPDGPADVSD